MLRLLSRLKNWVWPPPPTSGEYEGFPWRLNTAGFRDYDCRDCGTPLKPGPEGCGTLMAKCPKCYVLFESLPYFWDRP